MDTDPEKANTDTDSLHTSLVFQLQAEPSPAKNQQTNTGTMLSSNANYVFYMLLNFCDLKTTDVFIGDMINLSISTSKEAI